MNATDKDLRSIVQSFCGPLDETLERGVMLSMRRAYALGMDDGETIGRIREECAQIRCEECDQNYADPPSKLCPGCQAYREHQA